MNLIALRQFFLPLLFACTASASFCHRASAHGTPITVSLDGNQLVTSGGYVDAVGFTEQVFLNYGFDFFLEPTSSGAFMRTDIPGFDIHDVAPESELWIDPMLRPEPGNLSTLQALWYWNPTTRLVQPEATEATLLLRAVDFPQSTNISLLEQSPASDPPAIMIAEPTNGQLGIHDHILAHFLENTPAAQTGVYGYFAQLTSPIYESSDPFLVILNHGIASDADLLAGALAINASATDAVPLAGDYNTDGRVDAADYTVWRDNLGSTGPGLAADGDGDLDVDGDDYAIWRSNFGNSANASLTSTAASVPEPTAVVLLLGIVLAHSSTRFAVRRTPF